MECTYFVIFTISITTDNSMITSNEMTYGKVNMYLTTDEQILEHLE